MTSVTAGGPGRPATGIGARGGGPARTD